MRESECTFCQISSGAAPAHIVRQDADHVAFLDINPITAVPFGVEGISTRAGSRPPVMQS